MLIHIWEEGCSLDFGVGQNVSYTYVQHSDPDDGTITYNRVGSVTNEYVTLSDGSSSALTAEAFTYTYDASGNITEIKKNGATLFRYAYDSLNQLVREDNTLSGRTYVYTYDKAGNILSKKTYGYTTATTVSTTLYSTQTYTYGSSRSGDILTALNGSTISYDGGAESAELCHKWLRMHAYMDSGQTACVDLG